MVVFELELLVVAREHSLLETDRRRFAIDDIIVEIQLCGDGVVDDVVEILSGVNTLDRRYRSLAGRVYLGAIEAVLLDGIGNLVDAFDGISLCVGLIGAALVNERLRLRQEQFRRSVFRAVDISIAALNIEPFDRQFIALRGTPDTRLESVALTIGKRERIGFEILDFVQRDRVVVDFPFGLEFVCDILQSSIDVGVIELDCLLCRVEAFPNFPNIGPVALIEIPYDSLDKFVRLGAHRPFEAFIDGITHLI